MRTIPQITSRLLHNVADAQSQLAAFSEGFATDPMYAFQWADKAVLAAAKLQLAQGTLAFINEAEELGKPTTPEYIQEWLQRDLTRRALYPESSTSVCSNFVGLCRTQALAALVDYINGGF